MKKQGTLENSKDPVAEDLHSSTTRNWKLIKATREVLYHAFTDPDALEVWLAPGEMKGKVHSFDLRVGAGYRMSLFYPPSETEFHGKTIPQRRPIYFTLHATYASRKNCSGDNL